MEMKVCNKCLIEKSIDDFYFRDKKRGYRQNVCKACTIEERKKYGEENREKILERAKKYREENREKILERTKKYREENPDKIKETLKKYYENNSDKNKETLKKYRKNNPEIFKVSQKKYYENNRDEINERIKKWRKNNPDKVNETLKKYRKNNPDKIKKTRKKNKQIPKTKLSNSVRERIRNYLKLNNISKRNKTFDLVGCNPQELMIHLENRFQDNMTWDNYGLYGWHIDHIVPLSSAKTEEEIYKLCHYTNLQPLWAEENIKKSNKIIN